MVARRVGLIVVLLAVAGLAPLARALPGDVWVCSNCKQQFPGGPPPNCPKCGVRIAEYTDASGRTKKTTSEELRELGVKFAVAAVGICLALGLALWAGVTLVKYLLRSKPKKRKRKRNRRPDHD